MFLNDSSFLKFTSYFVANKTAVSRSLRIIIMYLVFAFFTTAICATNVLLSFLLFSNFCVVIFILITGIVIKSDGKYAINEWRDTNGKEKLMKEKIRITLLLFGSFLFINILFMILLSFLYPAPLKNPLDIQNSLLMYILFILELLLTKPFFYWLVNTQLEIGTITEFNTLITVDLDSDWLVYRIIIFFVIMVFSDFAITNYYTKGSFFNSSYYVTLILLVKILFILSIYVLIIRKDMSKKQMEIF